MAFLSGTLESLLLYNSSNDSQGGQPVYSMSSCSQAREPLYSDSGCSLAGGTACSVHQRFRGDSTNSEAKQSVYSQALYSQAGGSLYSKSQCLGSTERVRSLSDGQAQKRDMQDLCGERISQQLQYSKFRNRAKRVRTASRERQCSIEEEVWEPLDCMDTDPDTSVWTMSPTMSKSMKTALSPTDSDTATSAAGCSSIQRHRLSSCSSLQDVFETGEPGAKGFVTTKESTIQNSDQPSEKASTSRDLCAYSKAGLDLATISNPTQAPEEGVSDSKMLNEQCFQAAISEGFGSASQTLTYKVRPVKRFAYHVHNSRHHGSKQMGMEHLSNIQNKCQWDQNTPQSQEYITMSFSDTLNSVKSAGSACQLDSQDNLSSDSSSQYSKNDFFDKKYRYNHTALALQQSGLMKTTIKTAEILHRGKILQAELNKLRKETALFMRSVLSNPENQHFRDLYMKLHNNKIIN